MYPASNSSSTRPSHSLPPGSTPMLSAAPRTSTYGAGCPKICLRMCFNIPRAFSLIFRTLSSTTAAVRPPETLPYRAGAVRNFGEYPFQALSEKHRMAAEWLGKGVALDGALRGTQGSHAAFLQSLRNRRPFLLRSACLTSRGSGVHRHRL